MTSAAAIARPDYACTSCGRKWTRAQVRVPTIFGTRESFIWHMKESGLAWVEVFFGVLFLPWLVAERLAGPYCPFCAHARCKKLRGEP